MKKVLQVLSKRLVAFTTRTVPSQCSEGSVYKKLPLLFHSVSCDLARVLCSFVQIDCLGSFVELNLKETLKFSKYFGVTFVVIYLSL